jgi:predicted Fe-Mo cluster-binding NifX family protein
MDYKIAIATTKGEEVDLHFGAANRFSIYKINSQTGEYALEAEREVAEQDFSPDEDVPNPSCSACHEERVEYIAAETLGDCKFLLVGKIGPKPHRILLRNGVNTLETPYLPIGKAIAKLNDYFKRTNKEGE